jgi:hypothetical protein
MIREVTILTCNREVIGSNLSTDTDYPDLGFRVFLQSLQTNAGTVT